MMHETAAYPRPAHPSSAAPAGVIESASRRREVKKKRVSRQRGAGEAGDGVIGGESERYEIFDARLAHTFICTPTLFSGGRPRGNGESLYPEEKRKTIYTKKMRPKRRNPSVQNRWGISG